MTRSEYDLGNWRQWPCSRQSFQRVCDLIPCDRVAAAPESQPLPWRRRDLAAVPLLETKDGLRTLAAWLEESHADALAVLHRGELVYQFLAPHFDLANPHILFSVSKSVTGMLAGALADNGQLEFQRRVVDYIPQLAGSGYSTCTVQQVLDMQVALDFTESYLDLSGQYASYREATGWNPRDRLQEGVHLRRFLAGIGGSGRPDGEVFQYFSTNSDLLGWLCEAATGQRFADLLSQYLWQPMSAEHPAFVTVDAEGSARTAGGICAHLHDVARLGELMRLGGRVAGRQVLSARWVQDTLGAGSVEAWRKGGFTELAAQGRYRNQWYQSNEDSGAFFAIGIHGQWIYVDPAAETTVVKFSSQPEPVDADVDALELQGFRRLCRLLGEQDKR